jgi:hypothetical protein
MDNLGGSLCKIAETQDYFDHMNINKSNYKIIEVSQQDFNFIKLNQKSVEKYVGEDVIYSDADFNFVKLSLENYINNSKNYINQFLENNKNHYLFNIWNNYYNQLNNLDLNTIQYPLNKSLEHYFNDVGQPSLNILQLP